MRGRWLVNLLLLILVVLLGAAAQRELERSGPGPTLTDLDPGAIAEVVIERPGMPRTRLERTAEGWFLREPLEAPAGAERVARLLQIATAPVRRVLPSHSDLQALGLDPPRLTLTLDGLVLRIGGTEPLAQRRYVGVGDRVVLIDGQHYRDLATPPEGFADASGD
ncbi:MAG: DUF4340 domain-containing protein [Chromatiaceae bacterium]|jgi:hypothetical protein|nr:DUF4340 domain-containing protein [Chromatiaceae bacterium]